MRRLSKPIRRLWIGLVWGVSLFGALRLPAADLEIVAAARNPSGIQIQWSGGVSNRSYMVQTREALGREPWLTPFEFHAAPLTGDSWNHPRGTATSGFYRLLSVPTANRGKILSSIKVATWSPLQLQGMLAFAGIQSTVRFGVDAWQIRYETIGPNGARTEATGSVYLPQNPSVPAPLIAYQHGTIVQTNAAPSTMALDSESFVGLLLAADGYVAGLTDYLGLGGGPGLHPYVHARSEATAGVDVLRAARYLATNQSVALSGRVFVTGYSQGGHAALALHRELETYHTNEFTVTASAPAAGPYDLSGVTMTDFLSGRQMPNPYYLAYLLMSYRNVYGLTNAFEELMAEPYVRTLPALFDGLKGAGEINAAMPADARNIFKPSTLPALNQDTNHLVRIVMRDNDVVDWAPRAPVRLYHCSGDQDVIFANAEVARDRLRAAGAADVQIVEPVVGGDHGDCSIPSLLGAKAWFDTLR